MWPESHLPIWNQEVLDVLIMHGGGIEYRLHVEFLNVLVLPKPADIKRKIQLGDNIGFEFRTEVETFLFSGSFTAELDSILLSNTIKQSGSQYRTVSSVSLHRYNLFYHSE